MAGGVVAGARCIRAEAVLEQVQLQLECQLQAGHRGQNTLDALVDLDQVIHIGAAQLGGLFDLFVLAMAASRMRARASCSLATASINSVIALQRLSS